jgi:transcriptional repressor NrdR
MRFTTYERVGSARLIVVKRDGKREEFDPEKLAAGLAKALTRRPVGDDAAADAADAIEATLRSQGLNEVPSSLIGEMAMDHLRDLDHIAFIRFVSVYQSFDDLEQLKREVDALYAERTERTPGQTSLHLVEDERTMLPVGSGKGSPGRLARRRPSRQR